MIIIIWLMSLAVALHYNFTTNFLTRFDAERAFNLYNAYRVNPNWHEVQATGTYVLSNTALFDTFIPGVIQHYTHISPDVFYKVYLALAISLVPIIAYYIGKRFSKYTGLISAITVGSWVAFYQGGSFARLNFAVLFFGLLLLVLYSNHSIRYKVVIGIPISVLMVLAHYGTAGVAILLLSGVYVISLIKNRNIKELIPIGTSIIIIGALFWWWQVYVNSTAWHYITQMVSNLTQNNNIMSVFSRDKITQAVLGVSNPDNESIWTLNRWLLLMAWINVSIMLFGAWILLKQNIGVIYKSSVVLALIAIGIIVIVPSISRGYGIEKVYYQMLMILAPCVGIGIGAISDKIKVNNWLVASIVVIPYTILMYMFGIIPSALG